VDEGELTIEEALIELKLRGYEDVTDVANTHLAATDRCVYIFDDPSGVGVHYCSTESDVFDLL
jgi:hypothetical protein